MDAALDAMRPLGFRTQLILRTVNELLDVECFHTFTYALIICVEYFEEIGVKLVIVIHTVS